MPKPEEPKEPEPIEEPKIEAPKPIPTPKLTYAGKGTVFEIGTGLLDKHYGDGDVVDLRSLREKGLVGSRCKRVKVIVNGELTKRLIIRTDSCSSKACEAIVKAGGSVELETYESSGAQSKERGNRS